MLTHNKDVLSGFVNGTYATLEQVVVRFREQPFFVDLDNGSTVQAYFASQVEHLLLRHEQRGIDPDLFAIEVQTHTVTAKWLLPVSLRTSNKRKEEIPMKLNQFAIVRNTGTTGHKLQGKTVDSILVYDFHYGTNWPYVVMSRVKTMKGLYLRSPLKDDISEYTVPDGLTQLLSRLKINEPEYSEPSEYDSVADLEFITF